MPIGKVTVGEECEGLRNHPDRRFFCLGAPRTSRRAPEPGDLDAERKPGTARIQRRVELKFWPKTLAGQAQTQIRDSLILPGLVIKYFIK